MTAHRTAPLKADGALLWGAVRCMLLAENLLYLDCDDGFMAAGSKGQYLARSVKNIYPFERVQ